MLNTLPALLTDGPAAADVEAVEQGLLTDWKAFSTSATIIHTLICEN